MASSPPLFQALQGYTRWLDQKFETHTQNMVNSSMPGAKRRVMEDYSFAKHLASSKPGMAVSTTRAGHLQGAPSPLQAFRTKKAKDAHKVSLTGNNIDPQQELHDLNEATNEHIKMTNLMTRFHRIAKGLLS